MSPADAGRFAARFAILILVAAAAESATRWWLASALPRAAKDGAK